MTGTGKIMRIFRRACPGSWPWPGLARRRMGKRRAPQVVSPLRVECDVNGVNVATGRTTTGRAGPVGSGGAESPLRPGAECRPLCERQDLPGARHTRERQLRRSSRRQRVGIVSSASISICIGERHRVRCYLIDADPDPPDERQISPGGHGHATISTWCTSTAPGTGQQDVILCGARRISERRDA